MLTDEIIKELKPKKKVYKILDEDGLYIVVHPNPNWSKYWLLRYQFANKESNKSLGTYPDVSIEEARNLRDQIRKMVRNGINPKETEADCNRKNAILRNMVNDIQLEIVKGFSDLKASLDTIIKKAMEDIDEMYRKKKGEK